MKVISEQIIFNQSLKIQEAELKAGNDTFKRQRIQRQDAVAVLILNTDTQKVVLTKQFRYPVADKMNDFLLEIVAGKIDPGEEPLDTAIRETEEETGYRVQKENIKLICSCFSSPGYTTEEFYVYCATVTTSDKKTKGGGLEEEHEQIEVIEMDLNDFNTLLKEGKIRDAKTYVAGLYMMIK